MILCLLHWRFLLLFNLAVRRQENGEQTLLEWAFSNNDLKEYVDAIRHSPRAQEIRWLHNMLESTDSALYHDVYTVGDVAALLNRVQEALVIPVEL